MNNDLFSSFILKDINTVGGDIGHCSIHCIAHN